MLCRRLRHRSIGRLDRVCESLYVETCRLRSDADDPQRTEQSSSDVPPYRKHETLGFRIPAWTTSAALLTQRIGLTESIARVKNGRIVWDTECSTQRASPETEVRGKLWAAVRGWVVTQLRYYHGHAVDQFKALFLPVGYPHTVKDNYVRYSCLAALSNFFISTNTILSSTFLLYAVGLGAGAMPVAGALNWVIKDGIGQAGTLLLGRVVAHDFDINTRSWHFFANCAINVACIVEIATVHAPEHFLLLASLANTLKGVSYMAGGSTRAAFNISFTQGENIADITAKATSQYICTSLLGTCLGIGLAGTIGSDAATALAVSAVISAATAATTYATTRAVPLANLNATRMQLLLARYLAAARGAAATAGRATAPPPPVTLPRPSELCAADPVVALPTLTPRSPFFPPLAVNTPLATILHPGLDGAADKLAAALAVHRRHGALHLLLRDGRHRWSRLHVVLHRDAGPEDAVVAMLHASLLREELRAAEADVLGGAAELAALERTLAEAQRHRPALLAALRDAGWNLERVCIESDPSRGVWDP